MSKSFENSIGLRCLTKHREVDCVDSRILQCGCRQETNYYGRSGCEQGCVQSRNPVPGPVVRKFEFPLVIPRVTGVDVAGG